MNLPPGQFDQLMLIGMGVGDRQQRQAVACGADGSLREPGGFLIVGLEELNTFDGHDYSDVGCE